MVGAERLRGVISLVSVLAQGVSVRLDSGMGKVGGEASDWEGDTGARLLSPSATESVLSLIDRFLILFPHSRYSGVVLPTPTIFKF